ncbi:hypothetical protein [Candidatus Similichlamydia laticola]|uniref:Uncharacterized protein n=1 Tax=Candidatus Similichlamydia laticola TaxID=2170265 RepID=A0A369KAU0_9BACT|nr:hypothetical protein [Candidatus Similichlamydia laticola]RDB31721.1 hypothetical protein HAT2_00101 [Candidatus Similichlamydia laticola]
MNRGKVLLIISFAYLMRLCAHEVPQPYHRLQDLQMTILEEVCRLFDLQSSGTASSCYTAIRNLYWSFSSPRRVLSKEEAAQLLYQIYEAIYHRLNASQDLDLIKLRPCLDADFLHVVLFFRERNGIGDSSIDLMRGWTTFERYNKNETNLLFKERRLLKEQLEDGTHPALMPEEADFFNRFDFTTHLLLRQPFGHLFAALPDLLDDELNELGIIQFRLEDRACNVCDSSFGAVRKIFCSGKWIDPHPFPKGNLQDAFVRAVEKILHVINTNEQWRPYLANYPFSVEDIELVLIPSVNHSNEESWLQSVYNVGKNILFMGHSSEGKDNFLVQVQFYPDAKEFVLSQYAREKSIS